MKKLLIATLALITALSISLAACEKDKDKDKEPAADDPDDEFVVRDDKDDETDDTTKADGTTKVPTGTVVWTEKNDTVYVAANAVNLRAATSTSSKSEGKVNLGDALTRTKATTDEDNGWSEIKLADGKLVYIKTAYLTTNQNDTLFDPCEEAPITFDDDVFSVNLRSDPCLGEGTAIGSITDVQTTPPSITKIAVSKSGAWTKVKYNGKEYFLKSILFDGTSSNSPSGLG